MYIINVAGLEQQLIKFSCLHKKYWPVGQVVKTSPFHGGITGSNPVRVTICRSSSIGRATDL